MADSRILTPEVLRQLLDYDPETGKMSWKARGSHFFSDANRNAAHSAAIWNTRFAGKEAFTSKTKKGYPQTPILGTMTRGHRVAWALYYGEWPKHQIDHINGIRDDNRIANLRDVEPAGNQRNMKRPSTNTSGHLGVCWDKSKRRWMARLGRKMLGRFSDISDAIAAVEYGKVNYGYHKNHGRD